MDKLAKRQAPQKCWTTTIRNGQERIFSKARPASEVLPEIFSKAVADAMLKRGRSRKEVTRAPINIRLSHDVVDTFRATGRGWQTRVDEALKDWLKSHKPASNH